MEKLQPSQEEFQAREETLRRVLGHIRHNKTIPLPPFSHPEETHKLPFAFLGKGFATSPFSGQVQDYQYLFEGEEDLLHLIITRKDYEALTPEEGQQVASFLLEGIPPSLIWFKPGKYSQHFYCGHDHLLTRLKL